MGHLNSNLLNDIEAFLAETQMGPSYFGKRAVNNSEIVHRLRAGGRVWPETEAKLRATMKKLLEMQAQPSSTHPTKGTEQ